MCAWAYVPSYQVGKSGFTWRIFSLNSDKKRRSTSEKDYESIRDPTVPAPFFFLFLLSHSKLNNLTTSSFYIFCVLKFYSSQYSFFSFFRLGFCILGRPTQTHTHTHTYFGFSDHSINQLLDEKMNYIDLHREIGLVWILLNFRICGNGNCQWRDRNLFRVVTE